MQGVVEIEHFDKDGNLVRSFRCANEMSSQGFNINPPIRVLKDETLSFKTTYSLNCPDCQDGYYYPLVGMRERCQTCNN